MIKIAPLGVYSNRIRVDCAFLAQPQSSLACDQVGPSEASMRPHLRVGPE
jgi:hypothetical protein